MRRRRRAGSRRLPLWAIWQSRTVCSSVERQGVLDILASNARERAHDGWVRGMGGGERTHERSDPPRSERHEVLCRDCARQLPARRAHERSTRRDCHTRSRPMLHANGLLLGGSIALSTALDTPSTASSHAAPYRVAMHQGEHAAASGSLSRCTRCVVKLHRRVTAFRGPGRCCTPMGCCWAGPSR